MNSLIDSLARCPASGSTTKIAAAKSALNTVVKGLPVEAEVGLRVFGAKVFSRKDPGSCTDSQRVVDVGSDNRADLTKAIKTYKPYGETPILHALKEAAKDLGDKGDRSIVLVSDGESTCSPNPCEVAKDLAEDGIDLTIDVVGLSVTGKARAQLKCIAEKGNGTYYDADSAEEIESRLGRAAKRAMRPFTLTGKPIKCGPEDDPTEVKVGDWTDKLSPEGSATGTKSYWVERTEKDSTLRVSAISQGRRGGDDGLDIELYDPQGAKCDSARAIRQVDTRRIIGVQATTEDVDDENTCNQAGLHSSSASRRESVSTSPRALPACRKSSAATVR